MPAPEPEDRAATLDDETLAQLESECQDSLPALLQLFLSESEKRLRRMERAGVDGAPFDMAREAHTLKGAAISFGCPALSAAAARLEASAEAGDAAVDRLVRAVQRSLRIAGDALGRRYPELSQVDPASS